MGGIALGYSTGLSRNRDISAKTALPYSTADYRAVGWVGDSFVEIIKLANNIVRFYFKKNSF